MCACIDVCKFVHYSFCQQTVGCLVPTLRTVAGMLLVFLQTSRTDQLSTTRDLLWLPGHAFADNTEKVIGRLFHKLVIIASNANIHGVHANYRSRGAS